MVILIDVLGSVQALIKRKNSELSASNGNSPSSNGNYDNEDNKLNHHSLSRSSISEDNSNYIILYIKI